MNCLSCDNLIRCSRVTSIENDMCEDFVISNLYSIRKDLSITLGASTLLVIRKTKKQPEGGPMSNLVQSVVNSVLAGDVQKVEELCADSSIAITHLMLACRDFGDNNKLAQACTKVAPQQRRGIFVDYLIEETKRRAAGSENVQPQVEEVVEVEEQVQVEKVAPRRRRTAAAPATPVVEEVVVHQMPAQEVVVVQAPDNGISTMLQEVYNMQKALDDGISKDMSAIRSQVELNSKQIVDIGSDTAASLTAICVSLNLLHQKVEAFRAGTEALEIALISNGVIESAPFADSWASVMKG
jgi:hypothetical protein